MVTCTVSDGFCTVTASAGVSVECPGIHLRIGDANCDGGVDIADAICTLGYLFGPPSDPCDTQCCAANQDCNGDGAVDLGDAITVLAFLFAREAMTAPDGTLLQGGAAGCLFYERADVALPCQSPCGP